MSTFKSGYRSSSDLRPVYTALSQKASTSFVNAQLDTKQDAFSGLSNSSFIQTDGSGNIIATKAVPTDAVVGDTTGTFSDTVTGAWASGQTANWSYTKHGKLVTVQLLGFGATSNTAAATSFTSSTTSWPSTIMPKVNSTDPFFCTFGKGINGGSLTSPTTTTTPMQIRINSDRSWVLGTVSNASFSNATFVGISSGGFSYLTA